MTGQRGGEEKKYFFSLKAIQISGPDTFWPDNSTCSHHRKKTKRKKYFFLLPLITGALPSHVVSSEDNMTGSHRGRKKIFFSLRLSLSARTHKGDKKYFFFFSQHQQHWEPLRERERKKNNFLVRESNPGRQGENLVS